MALKQITEVFALDPNRIAAIYQDDYGDSVIHCHDGYEYITTMTVTDIITALQ